MLFVHKFLIIFFVIFKFMYCEKNHTEAAGISIPDIQSIVGILPQPGTSSTRYDIYMPFLD